MPSVTNCLQALAFWSLKRRKFAGLYASWLLSANVSLSGEKSLVAGCLLWPALGGCDLLPGFRMKISFHWMALGSKQPCSWNSDTDFPACFAKQVIVFPSVRCACTCLFQYSTCPILILSHAYSGVRAEAYRGYRILHLAFLRKALLLSRLQVGFVGWSVSSCFPLCISHLPYTLIYCLMFVWFATEHSVEDHWGKTPVFKLLESAHANSWIGSPQAQLHLAGKGRWGVARREEGRRWDEFYWVW